MSGGWFIFSVVTCIVLGTMVVLGLAILKAYWAQREREALTSSDLRALEESAVFLIEQLKSEAENAMSGLEQARTELQALMDASEKRIQTLRDMLAQAQCSPPVTIKSSSAEEHIAVDPRRQEVLEMASSGIDCSEIARRSGMDCAEVKLMLRLADMRMN